MLDRILRIKDAQARVNLDYAERMGYDAGKNGANEMNSHFAIFSTKELTKAWERGKTRGDAERLNAASRPEEKP